MTPNQPGYSDLINEHGVSKGDERFDVLGALDEASAAIGLAKSYCADEVDRQRLEGSQRDLSLIMGVIAGFGGGASVQQRLDLLEQEMTVLKRVILNPRKFILPGSTTLSAAFSVARTVVRRAERDTVRLAQSQGPIDDAILQYLNRLSTLCYLLELKYTDPGAA